MLCFWWRLTKMKFFTPWYLFFLFAGEFQCWATARCHGQAPQHPQHVGDRPCGSRQDYSDRLPAEQGWSHLGTTGWWQTRHGHPQGWTGARNHHQVHVSTHPKKREKILSEISFVNHWQIKGALGTRAPSQYKFFHFHAVFSKKFAK